jgi:hypothetical protein
MHLRTVIVQLSSRARPTEMLADVKQARERATSAMTQPVIIADDDLTQIERVRSSFLRPQHPCASRF